MGKGYYYTLSELNAATKDAKVTRCVIDSREVRYYYDNGVCAVFSNQFSNEIFLDVLYPARTLLK